MMSSDFTLRLLDEADIQLYQQLRLLSFSESPYAFSESYEDETKKDLTLIIEEVRQFGNPPEYYILGAFKAKLQLIGFVKFRRDQRSKARHKSMVHAMYVKPEYRNKKVGQALMNEVIARAIQLDGLEQIHLWVLHAATSTSDFYSKIGFESQGTIVKKDLKIGDTYIDAEYMVMYLNV